MVAVEKLARLGIASLVQVAAQLGPGCGPAWPSLAQVAAQVAQSIPIHRQLTHYVNFHDPMYVSRLIHVISRYLHSFIVLLLVFHYVLKYYVGVTYRTTGCTICSLIFWSI